MSIVTINAGGLVTQHLTAVRVYLWDWNTNALALGVTILTSVFVFTALEPSATDIALVIDQASILAGTRTTQCRIALGTFGQLYEVLNRITASDSPGQTKVLRFRLLIQ